MALTKTELLLPFKCRLKILFPDCVNLIKYLASIVNVVSSNTCDGLLLGIKIYFFLLSICTDDFKLAPKIMAFFSRLQSGNENSERKSNPIP